VKITRREFVRQSAASAAAAVAGVPLPGGAQGFLADPSVTRMTWSKAPCRFCGTGCGVNVAVKDGRVVATHGDINSEVNRGLNCVKGYFLSKIMYGEDRLTAPLYRPIRAVLPDFGGIDFSPLVLLLLIKVVQMLLHGAERSLYYQTI